MSTEHPQGQSPLPDGADSVRPAITPEAFQEVQASDDFAELRRRFRRFAFPMTAVFLVWYGAYVLASTYAPEFMATRAIGEVSIGMLWGFGQFLSTFVITWLYIRHANRRIDPLAGKLRERLESGTSGTSATELEGGQA